MYISPQLSAYRASRQMRLDALDAGKRCEEQWLGHNALIRHRTRLEAAQDMPSDAAIRHLLPILADKVIGEAFLDHFSKVMTDHPLVQFSIPATISSHSASVILYRSQSISISLVLMRSADTKSDNMVSFSNGYTGLALINTASVFCQLIKESPGDQLNLSEQTVFDTKAPVIVRNCNEAIKLRVVGKPALFLRANVEEDRSNICQRHYDLNTGALVGKAAGEAQSTRRMMLLSALRSLSADHHIEAMLEATYEPLAALRWQAMRECLATDVAGSIDRLQAMAAADPDAEIRHLAKSILPICRKKAA